MENEFAHKETSFYIFNSLLDEESADEWLYQALLPLPRYRRLYVYFTTFSARMFTSLPKERMPSVTSASLSRPSQKRIFKGIGTGWQARKRTPFYQAR